jgi:hypothetical protein
MNYEKDIQFVQPQCALESSTDVRGSVQTAPLSQETSGRYNMRFSSHLSHAFHLVAMFVLMIVGN